MAGTTPCRRCGDPVSFKPHPQNPKRLAPFDPDGEIHFARCKSGKPKQSYSSLKELSCHEVYCSRPITKCWYRMIEGGQRRLTIQCSYGHTRQIPHTEQNFKLVNYQADPYEEYDW